MTLPVSAIRGQEKIHRGVSEGLLLVGEMGIDRLFRDVGKGGVEDGWSAGEACGAAPGLGEIGMRVSG